MLPRSSHLHRRYMCLGYMLKGMVNQRGVDPQLLFRAFAVLGRVGLRLEECA